MGLGWLRRQNARQLQTPTDDGDAVCTIAVKPADQTRVVEKLSSVRQWVKLLNSGQQHVSSTPQQLHHSGQQANQAAYSVGLLDIPDSAAFAVWQLLQEDSRRTFLLVSKRCKSLFARCVRSLQLTSGDLKKAGGFEQLGRLHQVFPGLNQLHLHLGSDFDCLASRHLKRSQLPWLHTLSIDSKLRGETFHAAAKFIVQCPNLKVLQLPNQRCSSAADQRILAAVLEALPELEELDLGGGVCNSRSGASNALTPSVLR